MPATVVLVSRTRRPPAVLLAYAGLGLSALGWASAFIVGKVVLAELTPLPAAVWRYAAAAAAWAAFNLASRRVVANLSPALTNCIIYGVGGVVLYGPGWSEHPWAQLAAASPVAAGGILAMALLSSVVAGQLFLIGVRVLGVSHAVVFVYVVPVLTAALATTLPGETFELAQAGGGAAVLAGVYWTTRSRQMLH